MQRKLIIYGFLYVLFRTAVAGTQFQQFFPGYNELLTSVRDGRCADKYARQRTDPNNRTDPSGPCPELLSCMIENTNEAVKGNMAGAATMLGLMPTLLTFLSSSSSETALLSRRRPLLALFLATGSPAINPLQTFVYPDAAADLRSRNNRLLPQWLKVLRRTDRTAVALVAVEYLVALGALINTLTTCYYTGILTVSTLACTDSSLPMYWVSLNVAVHACTVFTLALQMESIGDEVESEQRGRGPAMWAAIIRTKIRDEFTPSITHDKLQLRLKSETALFIFASWFTSIGMVAYVIFGTVTFSSLVFIGYTDSIQLLARFTASTIACRVVLMFELSGMRNALAKSTVLVAASSHGDESLAGQTAPK